MRQIISPISPWSPCGPIKVRQMMSIKVKVINGDFCLEYVDDLDNKILHYGIPFGEKDIFCVLWGNYYRMVDADDLEVSEFINSINKKLLEPFESFKKFIKTNIPKKDIRLWDPHGGWDIVNDPLNFYNLCHLHIRKSKIKSIKQKICQI